jgi:dTDP-4-amino-4,6-dideoxygalactose transaminase
MSSLKKISLAEPVLGLDEKRALESVIDSNWITMGARVAEFERAFATAHNVVDAVAVDTCTAGLHLGLLALGVGPGDEVLVPSLTFVASVNVVLYVGATPVFVDIESLERPHISISDAEKKLTNRTKAIIVVHYGGYLVDLPAWRAFADAHGLALIEDAAHAPGVESVGCYGDAAAFSFFANKNMTTAEGGMVFAREPAVLDRVRRLRAHGMTTGTFERDRGHAFSYDVTMLGYNYRMDELRAAVGLVQLSRLMESNAKRRLLSNYYRRHFAGMSSLSVPFSDGDKTSAHLLPILLAEEGRRDAVMERLRHDGIQSSIHYPPAHLFSYYRTRFPGISLPETERFFAREITLPLHPQLTESDVDCVVSAVRNALK